MVKKEPRKITLGLVLVYFIGIVTFLIGLAGFITSFFGGILVIIGGILIFPPLIKYIENELNIHLSKWLKFIGFLVLFIIGMSLITSNSKSQEKTTQIKNQTESSTNTNAIETSSKSVEIKEPLLSIDEIKKSAIKVNYEDLMRNNEDYIGKVVYYRGYILQVVVISPNKYALLIYVTNKGLYWDDAIWLNYEGKRFLDGDIIDTWGEVKELRTYITFENIQTTIPEINVLQVELVEKAEDRI